MPRLSDTMEEGTLIEWLVADGATVALGEVIARIESDKADMPLEAWAEGTIRLLADPGMTLPVGARLAWIGDDGPPVAPVGPDSSRGERQAEPSAAAPAAPAGAAGASAAGRPRAKVSPLARRLAAEHGIDLSTLAGTGPGRRITREDVERSVAERAASSSTPDAGTRVDRDGSGPEPAAAAGGSSVVALSRVQQTIARRMAESRATVPDFEVEIDVELGPAAALRESIAAIDGAVKPSVNDMIVRACALALRRYPRLNGSHRDEALVLHDDVNVGVAVAVPDALLVPVVTHADRRSLAEITTETRRLSDRARRGELTAAELSGGTFTVSNLGMFGVFAVTSIINRPQAAILGVGAIREEVRRRDGELVDVSLCRLRLACDHRVVYGAEAAEFLSYVASLLERPLALLV